MKIAQHDHQLFCINTFLGCDISVDHADPNVSSEGAASRASGGAVQYDTEGFIRADTNAGEVPVIFCP
jgi:hypothetical protein